MFCIWSAGCIVDYASFEECVEIRISGEFVHPNTYVGTIGGTGYGKADYYAEHFKLIRNYFN